MSDCCFWQWQRMVLIVCLMALGCNEDKLEESWSHAKKLTKYSSTDSTVFRNDSLGILFQRPVELNYISLESKREIDSIGKVLGGTSSDARFEQIFEYGDNGNGCIVQCYIYQNYLENIDESCDAYLASLQQVFRKGLPSVEYQMLVRELPYTSGSFDRCIVIEARNPFGLLIAEHTVLIDKRDSYFIAVHITSRDGSNYCDPAIIANRFIAQ